MLEVENIKAAHQQEIIKKIIRTNITIDYLRNINNKKNWLNIFSAVYKLLKQQGYVEVLQVIYFQILVMIR